MWRRLSRQRRRRAVGRAYDMALELARVLPPRARVLDVGCGSGFIAHHLSAMLDRGVVGLDLWERADAPIKYLRYDGERFPVPDRSFDAVLLCYVLHHAQDSRAVLGEVRRVLRGGGLAVVYEDIPLGWWDRFVCWTHHLRWRGRTGPCAFRREVEWRRQFGASGFEVVAERQLSRWRNLAHPVSRRLYVLRSYRTAGTERWRQDRSPAEFVLGSSMNRPGAGRVNGYVALKNSPLSYLDIIRR
ncbi:MAG: class I SAM-dependent methyltransferase [Pyrinomonadaceae bacterium]